MKKHKWDKFNQHLFSPVFSHTFFSSLQTEVDWFWIVNDNKYSPVEHKLILEAEHCSECGGMHANMGLMFF